MTYRSEELENRIKRLKRQLEVAERSLEAEVKREMFAKLPIYSVWKFKKPSPEDEDGRFVLLSHFVDEQKVQFMYLQVKEDGDTIKNIVRWSAANVFESLERIPR